MLKLKLQYCGHLVQRADSLEKTLMLGKTEAGEEATEDEMVGWHHWLNGPESEQTPGDGEGQGSLVCCSLWGCKGSDTTEWVHNNNKDLLMRCNSVFYALSSSITKQEYILYQQAIELRIRIEFISAGPWKGWGTLKVSIPLLMFRAHWPCLSLVATPVIQKHKHQTWEKNQHGLCCIFKHNMQIPWESVLPRRMAPLDGQRESDLIGPT